MQIKNLRLLTLALVLVLAASAPAWAYNKLPGKGVKVRPARATWNTGYFQATLVERALKDLGFTLERTKELQNPIFYQSVYLGDVDYWPNGWFPNHNSQTPKNFYERAATVGYLIKAGGMQGYLVSKREVEKFNIKSLDDFRRPEVIKAFDRDDDGRADLVACPPGWGCEKVITHHFAAYDLDKYINPIKATYEASIADALARYRTGESVFFYTWAPNWTLYKFSPGKDVMWINVPEINASPGQQGSEDRMTVSGVTGAVTDPIKMGFVVSDIQIVANKKFLADNPAAEKLFELMKLNLADLAEQNNRMFEGENSAKDIERHVDQWIAKNKAQYESWLEAARQAAN